MRTVAVIGAGISGLAVSWLLSRRYRVLLFEKDDRLGGHTHTVVVEGQNGPLPLDTGFLVHNERTYPNLVRLFRELGVETRDSDMSFGVSCRRTGLEYSSRGLTGFFAQPSNLVSPRHLDLLREIVRFNREAPALLTDSENGPTLGEFLESRRFGDVFTDSYLLPMASAIWSTALAEIRRFPAAALVRFFHNHGLLTLTAQPTWKVVVGGSHVYVPRLVSPLADSVYRGVTINAVNRTSTGVTLAFVGRPSVQVDEVVFACHGDQVLPILSDPSDAEREVLGRFRTTTNVACLHTDSSYLPVRARARASWNYLLAGPPEAPPVEIGRAHV